MKVLHLLSGGGVGGIEMLCLSLARVSSEQHEFCFLFHGGEIMEQMKTEKIPVHDLTSLGKYQKLSTLVKLVKEKAYDAVIVHHEGNGIYFYYLALGCLAVGPYYVKYLHCSYEPEYLLTDSRVSNIISTFFLKKTLKRSNQLISVSEFVKKSYCETFGISSSKVEVIYNGIPLKPEEIIERKQNKESNVLRLLYIGRMVEVKGVRVLLEAISILKNQDIKVEVYLLGDGEKKGEFENLAKTFGIEDIVHFEGVVLSKESYYRESDIFVYPSVWQEAFGISIVEAMNSGLICIGSNVGGIPEIIENKENGLLFEKGSAQDLADTIIQAKEMIDSKTDSKMIEKAKKRAHEFSVEEMVKHLESKLI